MMRKLVQNYWSLAACLLLLLTALGLIISLRSWQKPLQTASAKSLPETNSGSSPSNSTATPASALTNAEIKTAYGKLPLSFEQNTGQTDAAVDFIARGAGYSLFLEATEAVFVLSNQSGKQRTSAAQPSNKNRERNSSVSRQSTVMRMKLLGANPKAAAEGAEKHGGTVNYFVGNDQSKWRSGIATFGRVNYKDVYPGIEATYYGNQQQLEYDFLVQPGADYKQIKLNFAGARRIKIEKGSGDLLLRTPAGLIRQHRPKVYQNVAGNKQEVAGRYLKRGREIGFEVGEYDQRLPLIIDPTLVYSTYLGGSGADYGNSVAVDSSGNAYIAGYTASINFVTANPIQGAYSGGSYDAFITKINPGGTALIYSTYLGGSGADYGNSIAVDSSSSAYLTGGTTSTNFPTINAIQPSFGGGNADAFVTKINASGTALVYSTYLGGTGDNSAYAIAVDSTGNAYVTGYTTANFPIFNPIQSTYGGNDDAFVTKINAAGTAFIYSTYLGGSNDDYGNSIAVDSSGNAYLTGDTASTNFPTVNPIQSTYSNFTDAFVTKINAEGTMLVYSTYLGGSDSEDGNSIAVDSSGNVYLTGDTRSNDFPTSNPIQATKSGGFDTFITKINQGGTALVYSTFLGGSGDEAGSSIAVDSTGNVYFTGFTDSTNFPTLNPTQSVYGGGNDDVFVTKINAVGTALIYSTYLGGNNQDYSNSIKVDSAGNIYLTGITSSTNFPTVNPIQSNYLGGSRDAFVTKINSAPLTRMRFDFDGDGKADLAVFRPSNGVWYLLGSITGFSGVQFGILGDQLAAADYDGDGKTDIAVFRSGTWYVLQSSNNLLRTAVFGQSGDLPIPEDFDLDGRADLTVFRPSTGTWYRLNSSNNQFVATQFGQMGDVPSAGDFDGDGRADLAVYRASNGIWYRLLSVNNQFAATQFGQAGDLPSAADYDGDGRTDLAVYRPSSGVWYRLNSSNGSFAATPFGVSEDVPVAADYDGDGKADIAVFRPSNGIWYLLRSTAGFTAAQFGVSTDQPIQAQGQ